MTTRAYDSAYDQFKKEEKQKAAPRPVQITPGYRPPAPRTPTPTQGGVQYTAPIGPLPGTGAPMPSSPTSPIPTSPLATAVSTYNQGSATPASSGPTSPENLAGVSGTGDSRIGQSVPAYTQTDNDAARAAAAAQLADQQTAGVTTTGTTGGGATGPITEGGITGGGKEPGAEAPPSHVEPDRGSTSVAVDGTKPESIVQVGQTIMNEYMSIINGASDAGRQALAALSGDFFKALDAAQAQLMTMFKDQMGGVDDATMMALNQLRDSAKEHRKTMLEDMARRGILQSGIAIEADLRLDKNRMTAEQQLLADRVKDLQNRMTDALMQFGSQRLDAIQRFGLAGVELESKAGDQQLSAMQTAMQQAMGITQFGQQMQRSDRAFDEGVRQFNVSSEQRAQENAAQKGLQWAQLAESQKANEIRQAELELSRERAQAEAAGGDVTSDALLRVYSYPDRESAMAFIRQPQVWAELQSSGVDLARVLSEINKMKSRTDGANAYTQGALSPQ